MTEQEEYKPFRLEPYTSTKDKLMCFRCWTVLNEVTFGDGTTGRYYSCPNKECTDFNKTVHERFCRVESKFGPLGKVGAGRRGRSATQFVVVNKTNRRVTAGPNVQRTGRVTQNRTFNRDPYDTSLGYRPEYIPLLAGSEDKDMLALLNHGVMTSLVTSGEEGEIEE